MQLPGASSCRGVCGAKDSALPAQAAAMATLTYVVAPASSCRHCSMAARVPGVAHSHRACRVPGQTASSRKQTVSTCFFASTYCQRKVTNCKMFLQFQTQPGPLYVRKSHISETRFRYLQKEVKQMVLA